MGRGMIACNTPVLQQWWDSKKHHKVITRTKILMRPESQLKVLRVGVCLLVMLVTGIAHSDQFRTKDPLKAFVNEEYPWGDDYFIHGNRDTIYFSVHSNQENCRNRRSRTFRNFDLGQSWWAMGDIPKNRETATTCIPARRVSLTLHALSGVSPKNISYPANANGSVGGPNNRFYSPYCKSMLVFSA